VLHTDRFTIQSFKNDPSLYWIDIDLSNYYGKLTARMNKHRYRNYYENIFNFNNAERLPSGFTIRSTYRGLKLIRTGKMNGLDKLD
jgi:hypothetical protein